MTDVEIVEIYGRAQDAQTDALRVLAPGAKYVTTQSDVEVVLTDGRRIGSLNAVVDLIGADITLVKAALGRDLKRIDEHLLSRTFLIGNSLSVTDRVVLGLLHSFVSSLPDAELYKYCCVARWFDHVQFVVPVLPHVNIKTTVDNRPQKEDKKAKKKAPGTSTAGGKDAGASTSSYIADAASFDIRIGKIVQIEAHPTDPGLYVEQIDLGEGSGPRQIVSGLAKFVPISEMQNRYVCVLMNISACEIKGVPSAGLVLCASNPDHTVVEPIRPPDAVSAGERIMFPGVPAQDLIEVIKPKKLHKLFKLLKSTDDPEPFAVCGDLPFMTSRGRIQVSPTLRNCPIK